MRTIRSISPGSVFKVAFVTYLLLFAIFGCLFLLIPGALAPSLLRGLPLEGDQLPAIGGGIVATVVIYGVVVFLGAFVQSVVAAIGALFYNLVAGLVGGVEVELRD